MLFFASLSQNIWNILNYYYFLIFWFHPFFTGNENIILCTKGCKTLQNWLECVVHHFILWAYFIGLQWLYSSLTINQKYVLWLAISFFTVYIHFICCKCEFHYVLHTIFCFEFITTSIFILSTFFYCIFKIVKYLHLNAIRNHHSSA